VLMPTELQAEDVLHGDQSASPVRRRWIEQCAAITTEIVDDNLVWNTSPLRDDQQLLTAIDGVDNY
jgi:hypothetical protein